MLLLLGGKWLLDPKSFPDTLLLLLATFDQTIEGIAKVGNGLPFSLIEQNAMLGNGSHSKKGESVRFL